PIFCSWFPGVYSIIPYGLNLSNPSNYNIEYKPGTLCVVWWYCPSSSDDNSRTSVYSNPIVSRSSDPSSNSVLATNQLTKGQQTITYQNTNNDIIAGQSTELLSKENLLDETYTTSVYPNPTHGIVTVKVGNVSLSGKDIVITDLLGQVFSSASVKNIYANTVVLDMSNFRSGIYLIKIMVNGTYKTFKVIKL